MAIGLKEWKKPELIVLVRSHPEEAVLIACKSGSSSYTPAYAAGCNWGHDYACFVQADS